MTAQLQVVPTPDDVITLFHESDAPVFTASEVGEELDVSRRTALRWLKELEEEGRVEKKEVGARAVVWWLVAES